MGLNLADYLAFSAQAHSDKVAVIFEGTRLTYAELLAQVNQVANVLRHR